MRSESRLPALWLSALLLVALAACADTRRGPPAPPSPAFVVDVDTDGGLPSGAGWVASGVHDLLVEGCISCHGATGEAADTAWVLTGDPDDDYVESIPFIDESDPEGSRLVSKALGAGHQGGAVYRRGSSEHTSLLNWIHQGALP